MQLEASAHQSALLLLPPMTLTYQLQISQKERVKSNFLIFIMKIASQVQALGLLIEYYTPTSSPQIPYYQATSIHTIPGGIHWPKRLQELISQQTGQRARNQLFLIPLEQEPSSGLIRLERASQTYPLLQALQLVVYRTGRSYRIQALITTESFLQSWVPNLTCMKAPFSRLNTTQPQPTGTYSQPPQGRILPVALYSTLTTGQDQTLVLVAQAQA